MGKRDLRPQETKRLGACATLWTKGDKWEEERQDRGTELGFQGWQLLGGKLRGRQRSVSRAGEGGVGSAVLWFCKKYRHTRGHSPE